MSKNERIAQSCLLGTTMLGDAVMTAVIVSLGGQEANPFMFWANADPWLFALVKTLVTAVCLVGFWFGNERWLYAFLSSVNLSAMIWNSVVLLRMCDARATWTVLIAWAVASSLTALGITHKEVK